MRPRRTALIVTLALGLLSVPLAAHAQTPAKVSRIGFLTPAFSVLPGAPYVAGWLQELGYIEGKNVAFEHRYAVETDELPELAAELVRLKVDVIVTMGTSAARATKQATRTIPIVMLVEGDPVRAGLVASLARPGGNVTGMTALVPELSGKRLELLKEAVTGLTRVGVLWNPADPDKAVEWRETQPAARLLGVELQSLEVRSANDFESAFEAAINERAGALLVLADKLTASYARQITDLTTKNGLPSMYSSRWFVGLFGDGGLMSYGPRRVDLSRRVAAYVDKILKGANPAELPVERPTQFELVINLKT
ncbi:MAG: ABC transporter substrate-binding protein, partial [Thermoplasmata archaeon]